LLANVLAAFLTNVPTRLTDEDRAVFSKFYGRYEAARRGIAPEAEIKLIRDLQADVLKKVPFGPGIPAYSRREPIDVMARDSGLCYDRSRLFDKLFMWAGFETRHIYILWMPKANLPFTLPVWVALWLPSSESHAVTEVKTSRGWVVVESNVDWVSVNRRGEILDADNVWQHASEFDNIPEYLRKPFWAIRGLYSRKGHLYSPYYVPYPQFNWPDFLTSLAQ
jgi:hypothetical protein